MLLFGVNIKLYLVQGNGQRRLFNIYFLNFAEQAFFDLETLFKNSDAAEKSATHIAQ